VALFRREAQISLRLRHRAIARVYEVGCVGASWFLAMELVAGESLSHLLRAEREWGDGVDPRLVAWVGAEIDPQIASARMACERLLAKGVLSKETHDTVVRLAPPLVIARDDLDFALDRFEEVLRDLSVSPRPHPVAA